MTIELAPHHMLIVADHWAIIPWNALRKSRGFLGLCSWGSPGSGTKWKRTGRGICVSSERSKRAVNLYKQRHVIEFIYIYQAHVSEP